MTENHKAPTVEGPTIQVRRTGPECCGMTRDHLYEAVGDVEAYVSVHLPNGNWTSPHFAPGFFAVTQKDKSDVRD